MNVLTAYLADTGEWLFGLVNASPQSLHVRPSDGSFWSIRPQRPSDFDEDGVFTGDAPPGAKVVIQEPQP